MFPSPPSSPVPLYNNPHQPLAQELCSTYTPPPLTPPHPRSSAFIPIQPLPVQQQQPTTSIFMPGQTLLTPPPPPTLTEWVDILKPSWKYLSLFSSTSDLLSFARLCSSSGYSPKIFLPDPDPEHISQVLNISLEDSTVVVLGLRWNKKNLPESVQHRLALEALNVKEKNYVREYTKADTFEGIVISTSGPKAVLAAEQQIHSVILFPIAFFLGMSLNNLTAVTSSQVESGLGVAAHTVSVVNFLLYTFTIINSITQSVIISYATLTDYGCAYYLSKKLFIRLSDVITFCVSLLFLTPLEITLNLYSETGYNYSIFWIWLGVAIFFITATIVYNGLVIFNTRTLYEDDGISKISLKNLVNLKHFESHMKAIGSWRKRDYAESYWRSSIANVFAEKALKIKKN